MALKFQWKMSNDFSGQEDCWWPSGNSRVGWIVMPTWYDDRITPVVNVEIKLKPCDPADIDAARADVESLADAIIETVRKWRADHP